MDEKWTKKEPAAIPVAIDDDWVVEANNKLRDLLKDLPVVAHMGMYQNWNILFEIF